ncbi:MAG: hypothetical protein ACTJGG_10355 [Marinomonas foliarum]
MLEPIMYRRFTGRNIEMTASTMLSDTDLDVKTIMQETVKDLEATQE